MTKTHCECFKRDHFKKASILQEIMYFNIDLNDSYIHKPNASFKRRFLFSLEHYTGPFGASIKDTIYFLMEYPTVISHNVQCIRKAISSDVVGPYGYRKNLSNTSKHEFISE